MSELVPILAEFMTTGELAAALGRNKRTLDRWDALGIGPPRTRVGRTVLYRRSRSRNGLQRKNSLALPPFAVILPSSSTEKMK
jgi:hypothetical protein